MLKTKTIFITGSGSGFGYASAISLAKRGHKVIATTHTEASAKDLNTFAKDKHLDIESFKLDISAPEDRNKIKDYDIDVLINNAATGQSGSLAEIPLERLQSDFEVNVFGTIALTQLALKNMIKKNFGTVVFISYLAARAPMPFLGSYSMTKSALSSGVSVLRKEIKNLSKNIHISLIEPGAYHTGFNQKNIAKKYEWMDESSFFFKKIDKLKKDENSYFEKLELNSTKSIVNKIVRACEVDKPKKRYSAPWWQSIGAEFLKMFN